MKSFWFVLSFIYLIGLILVIFDIWLPPIKVIAILAICANGVLFSQLAQE